MFHSYLKAADVKLDHIESRPSRNTSDVDRYDIFLEIKCNESILKNLRKELEKSLSGGEVTVLESKDQSTLDQGENFLLNFINSQLDSS